MVGETRKVASTSIDVGKQGGENDMETLRVASSTLKVGKEGDVNIIMTKEITRTRATSVTIDVVQKSTNNTLIVDNEPTHDNLGFSQFLDQDTLKVEPTILCT